MYNIHKGLFLGSLLYSIVLLVSPYSSTTLLISVAFSYIVKGGHDPPILFFSNLAIWTFLRSHMNFRMGVSIKKKKVTGTLKGIALNL